MSLSKRDLVERFDEFLTLSQADRDILRTGGTPEGIVIQVSSGSTGAPLRIPRTREDVGDIATRVATPFVRRFGHAPRRIALIGGISHSEAAAKLGVRSMEMRSFDYPELTGLGEYRPDVISCYPSVLREIPEVLQDSELKCIKLGGERFFAEDLNRVFAARDDLLVIEQLGSTEMPAVAIRSLTAANRRPSYELQTARFDFIMPTGDGWHPLVVKDRFASLAFRMNDFYDTGDELYWTGNAAYDVRRRNDISNEWFSTIEELLVNGCRTVQIRLTDQTVRFTGSPLPGVVVLRNIEFNTVHGMPVRIQPSNKAPLVVP